MDQIPEKKRKKSIIPNILTITRIIGAIVTLFLPFDASNNSISIAYYIVYGACGLTDAFDGFIARKTNSTSQFGSILDSIADWVFYLAMCYKLIIPIIDLKLVPFWILLVAAVVVRIVVYSYVFVKFRKFDSIHTYGSKLTGAFTFLIPYYFLLQIPSIGLMITVIVGLLASIEQMIIHFAYNEYDESIKSVFLIKKAKAKKENNEQ